ncbi:hypothetical protein [Enterococcus sp. BWR-S5]|uniref:hypothetical protein n=1 Tax=Enterococcus sp. BWR-S5 TaxID=2787714 RepID=UPI001923DD88|nr:hypothetical protein [Enterococcus sp. BWR-S5]MBL1224250.1 hypothetical protein [Enterococcus sp. BWR-S5]
MKSWVKINKELRNGIFTEPELLEYLYLENDSILYNSLSIIAKIKTKNEVILQRVKCLASGKDPLSTRGIPRSEIQYVAIAALWSLGEDKESFDLTEDEIKNVNGIYYQKSWSKSLDDTENI